MGFVDKPKIEEDILKDFYGEVETVLKDLLKNDPEVEFWRDRNKIFVGLKEEEVVRRFLTPGRIVVLRRSYGHTEGSVEVLISKTVEGKISMIENELSNAGLMDG